MREKTYFMDQLYHGPPKDQDAAQGVPHTGDNYRYKRFWGLRRFEGSHPAVMSERIRAKGWHWDLGPLAARLEPGRRQEGRARSRRAGHGPAPFRVQELPAD